MTDPEMCAHCGGPKRLRNPSGACDHLYWPDYLTDEAKRANGIPLPIDELAALRSQLTTLRTETIEMCANELEPLKGLFFNHTKDVIAEVQNRIRALSKTQEVGK